MPTKVVPLDSMPSPVRRAIQDGAGYAECPSCLGGSSRRLTLGLNQVDSSIVFAGCFRASCNARYTIIIGEADITRRKIKPATPFDKPTIPVQGEPLSILRQDYGLNSTTVWNRGWRLTEHGTALVIPILDRFGQELGHITRTLPTQGMYERKRVFTYKATERPFLDMWQTDMGTNPMVIVEDCLSAARLSQCGMHAVALLGTSMSTRDAKEIAVFSRQISEEPEVFLALDADAWDKTLKYSRKYAHILKMIPMPLQRDIKDETFDDTIKQQFGVS